MGMIFFSFQTISWVTKLDTQLYPVITTDASNPKDISAHIQKKLETVLPDIKRAQCEVEQRIKTAESLIQKAQPVDEKSLNVKSKLVELNQKLLEITSDYQTLLQTLISYFNGLTEIDKNVDKFNSQIHKTSLPRDVNQLEVLVREQESSKHHILEMFRNAQNDCDGIVTRIQRQVERSRVIKKEKKIKDCCCF